MGEPGSIQGDTVDADAPAGDGGATEAAREEFLRQALAACEQGTIDTAEYAARARALQGAGSVAEMAAIAARPAGPAPAPAPRLDPVDLALLARSPAGARARRDRSRYGAVVVVAVVFALLLVAGLWMASRVHVTSGAGGGVVLAPVAAAFAVVP